MLMALLPFTAWAVTAPTEYTIGAYKYSRSVDVVLSTNATTAPTITIKKGDATLSTNVIGICDANKNAVASFATNPAGGLYYVLVSFTDGAEKRLYVPFYVAGELNATLVSTKDLYDESLAEGGAYWYYYQEWKRSDVWYHWAETTTDLESDGVLLMPGDQPDPTAADHVNESGRLNSSSSTYRDDAEAWYDALKAGTYGSKISHSWWAAKASKPKNYAFSFHTAAATEAWKVAVVYNGVEKFPWGDRVFGSQEGQKHYGLYSVDGPVPANVDIKHDFDIDPSNFVESKFKMYLIPTAALPSAVFNPVYVTVAPANVQFDYGTVIPQNGSTATEDMIGNVSSLGTFTKAQVAQALTFKTTATITDAGNYVYDLTIKENYNNIPGLEDLNLTVTGGSGQLKVVPKSLTDDMIATIASVVYNGQKHTPTPEVSYLVNPADESTKITLVAGTHFDYSYGDANANINAGTGTVTITAIENTNYKGTASKTFTISKRPLTTVTVAPIPNQTYNYGSAVVPTSLTVTAVGDDNANYTLTANDYTAAWENNFNATTPAAPATGTLSAAADGNFTFAQQTGLTFAIDPKDLSATDIAIAEIGNQTYTGTAVEPVVTVNWTINEAPNDITGFLKKTYTNNTVVGKATVTVEPDPLVAGSGNYTGSRTANFNITPADITGVTITFGTDYPVGGYEYDGTDKEPTVIVNGGELEEGTDFEIVKYENNKNVGTATVTIKGLGNYDAVDAQGHAKTNSGNFTIKKRVLNVKAPATVAATYGIAPTITITTNKVDDIGGTLSYKVYDNEACTGSEVTDLAHLTVGTTYYIKPAWETKTLLPDPIPDGHTADEYDTQAQYDARANYDMTYTIEKGVINVSGAVLTIKVENKEKLYGTDDPGFTYEVYNGQTKVTGIVFTVAPNIERTEDGENVKAGGYTISVTNKAAVAAANYTFDVENSFVDGKLTINPFPITLTANDQTILYGSEPNTSTAFDAKVKNVVDGNEVDGAKITVTFSPVQLGNGDLIDRESLNLDLEWDENGAIDEHTNALTPSIDNANFTVTKLNKGKVTVTTGNAIILDRNDANLAQYIATYDDKTVNVRFAARSINKDTWYPMVLPFSTTVAEFSRNIGYAVVNRVDATKNDDDIHLKLHMTDLPANKPFLFKVGDDGVDLSNVNFKFSNVVIDWVANEVEDADLKGNALVGTYVSKSVFAANEWYRKATTWAQGPVTLTSPLLPLSAFVRMKTADSSARILVEEPDGSTTAINVITGEQQNFAKGAWYTIDGVMVNGIPTAKGVYIQNGKKVVIK